MVGNDSLNSGRVELVSSMQLQNFVVVTIDIRISQNAFEISCDDRKKLSADVLLKACSDEVGGHLDVIFQSFWLFGSNVQSFDWLGQNLVVICDDDFWIFS